MVQNSQSLDMSEEERAHLRARCNFWRHPEPAQKTLLGRKLSLNCLFAGRNNNNFDLCRLPGIN